MIEKQVEQFRITFDSIRNQIQKRMVGLDDVIDRTVSALFLGGHVLLEGVPGLGKTLLVKSLSETLDLNFSRIQFTPDLMPADIIGTNLIMEDSQGRKAFVTDVSYLGSFCRIEMKVESGEVIAAQAPPGTSYTTGQAVCFTWNREDEIHL